MTSTPPQQYCLRWNNYQNNLTNVFDQLLQSEAFVDVTLACEGHSLKAHKVVLSACSPYFQSLFFDNPCKHPIVILNGIKWDELKSVVEFMYRGEINVSQEQLAPLLKVAEVLKIRGLADVSRGGPGSTTLGASNPNDPAEKGTGRNLGEFLANSNHEILDSGSDSPSHLNGHSSHHHSHASMHPISVGNNPPALSPAQAHLMLASLSRRKRRKMSTPERTPSPPDEDMDDHSNQLEIDSTNGDYDHSPPMSATNRTGVSESPNHMNAISMSLNSSPANNHGHGGPHGSHGGSSSLGSIGPALLNLHAAAAAAAAVANAANQGSSNSLSGSGNQAPNSGGGSSSVSNDLDIKPGIVEMIREEERAKMLESAHGWLGPSNSTLSDSYQYQIQNLWQKCWNQNQTGMMHALRFRERGPLKSWRPETMAEAIFAVLREGLSLSQAARKYDIPYPTFVLYANRVHNMLGPSADGCTSSDLMSDMRPKGRGRPQRILLGTWPEEHIRGVIRAVVFRDTQTKDDMPFVFNRDGGLCIPQTPGGSHNGIDMSLHQQFGSNPFVGSSSSSQGQSNTNSSPLPGPSTSSSSQQGINLINLNESGNAAQHLQIQMSHGTSASSSTSSSPLQQALTTNALSGIGAQAQSQLLALQQRHLQQQLQLQHRRSSSSDHNLSLSPPQGLSRKNSYSHHHGSILGGKESPEKDRGGEKEILKIKTELLAPFDMDDEDEEVLDDEEERVIQDHENEVGDEDEIDDHQNEVGLGNRSRGGSYGGTSCAVKDLSQSHSSSEQDLSCNNNKSPNTSTNNNNNNSNTNNNHANVIIEGNSIDEGQPSQRDCSNDRLPMHERGEVNTPSPKNVDHKTTTSS